MTLTGWDIYWITRLDSIKTALQALITIGGVSGAIGIFIYAVSGGLAKEAGAFAKCVLPLAAVLLILSSFVPSTRSAAAIAVLPAIVNSEAVQQLPVELTTLVKEWLIELRPKKETHK